MKNSRPYTVEEVKNLPEGILVEYHYDCDETNIRKVVWIFKGRQDNLVTVSACNRILILTLDLKDYGLTPYGWRLWPHVPDAET